MIIVNLSSTSPAVSMLVSTAQETINEHVNIYSAAACRKPYMWRGVVITDDRVRLNVPPNTL